MLHFPRFEGFNRVLLASFNGTRHHCVQIGKRLGLRFAILMLPGPCQLTGPKDMVIASRPMSTSELTNAGLQEVPGGVFKRLRIGKRLVKAGEFCQVRDLLDVATVLGFTANGEVLVTGRGSVPYLNLPHSYQFTEEKTESYSASLKDIFWGFSVKYVFHKRLRN